MAGEILSVIRFLYHFLHFLFSNIQCLETTWMSLCRRDYKSVLFQWLMTLLGMHIRYLHCHLRQQHNYNYEVAAKSFYFCGHQNMRNNIKCHTIRKLEVENWGCNLCVQTLSKEMEVSWICIIKLNKANQEIIGILLYDTFILYLKILYEYCI